ncbi:MAG: hypothetical protein QM704_26950 [Anaeromyxobacteraceae bacterium]
MKHLPLVVPAVGLALLVGGAFLPSHGLLDLLRGVVLVAAVLAAVHHAEVVAHRVGEPFGTLVLALAVTVIEVALVVSMMLAAGPEKAALARDTIFSTVMIIANGVIGLCVLVGGLRHREQSFKVEGMGPAFASLVTLATLVLVLPTFTQSAPGPVYSHSQLVFAGLASLTLWGVVTFAQTVRHRDYFLPPGGVLADDIHAEPPSARRALLSLALLFVSLVSVVGLAKVLSPRVEEAVAAAGAPESVIGIAIALVVLLPETVAAVRAARADRLQTSLNLALGSALATIGLTIPVVVAASLVIGFPLVLGLEGKDLVLLLLTAVVGAVTLGPGRTSILQGAIHLVVFAAFLFLALVP